MNSIKTLIPAEDVLTTEMENVLGGIHIVVNKCSTGNTRREAFPTYLSIF